MQKNWAILLATSAALLAGCGGGGSSDSVQPAGQALAGYVGSWQADCDDHERESAVITLSPSGNGSIDIATTSNYYSGRDCSGALLATQTISAKISASPNGTVDTSVKLSANTAASTITVNKINSTLPQYQLSVTGPGVKYVTIANQQQWCIDFGNGSSTCIYDEGTQKAQTNTGGLYLRGNEMFVLGTTSTGFAFDTRYVRQ
ncbi:hypothetical protein [Janthinobacterium sp.]|uniref:hypothetical protein n=1 Tax=Janthinobacterium sp. TaxID=1871054 RepID=UPI002603BD18|nr:hypothetical protein [Janthinobacterium sp.]